MVTASTGLTDPSNIRIGVPGAWQPVGATPRVLPCSSSARTLRSTKVFWRGRSSKGPDPYCAQAGRFGLAGCAAGA